jgi:predicted acyl esterase
VEWIAAQQWCDGKVGTWGPSALGAIQFSTASQHPPHLVCAVPLVKDYKTKYTDYYYGGVYRKEHVGTLQTLGLTQESLILEHPTRDITWQIVENSTDDPDSIGVPVLMISGWYDHFPDDIIRAFHDLKERGDPAVRQQHKLVMGPWTHSGIGKLEQGELEYPGGVGVSDEITLRFFDHYLRGVENGYEQEPVVRYFQMGADEWRTTNDWYDVGRDSVFMKLYLGADRTLSPVVPANDTQDTLRYDPRDPSPTVGGARLALPTQDPRVGPYDQSSVESRSDALVYSTPVLDEEIEIIGKVRVFVYLSPDRTDTDIAVRLCDVYPDGRSILLTQGIHRGRFRNGVRPQDTSAMVPGMNYGIEVELQHLAITFRRGHRLRIIITGSNYPQYDLNPNTGGPLYQPGDTLVATSVLHMGPSNQSLVVFPVPRTVSHVDATEGNHSTTDINVFPNPVSTEASITFTTTRRSHVTVKLYDQLQHEVGTLADKEHNPGDHTLNIDVSQLPSGVYYAWIDDGSSVRTVPIVVAR